MYLAPEAVGPLFNQCAAATGAGSRIVFAYVGTRKDGRPDAGPWTWLVPRLLEASGEPWLWSIQPKELGPFLKKHNWLNAPGRNELSDRYGVEFIGVAMK